MFCKLIKACLQFDYSGAVSCSDRTHLNVLLVRYSPCGRTVCAHPTPGTSLLSIYVVFCQRRLVCNIYVSGYLVIPGLKSPCRTPRTHLKWCPNARRLRLPVRRILSTVYHHSLAGSTLALSVALSSCVVYRVHIYCCLLAISCHLPCSCLASYQTSGLLRAWAGRTKRARSVWCGSSLSPP